MRAGMQGPSCEGEDAEAALGRVRARQRQSADLDQLARSNVSEFYAHEAQRSLTRSENARVGSDHVANNPCPGAGPAEENPS